MQTTAQGFLIFELTHSPAYLGYVGFISGIPSWLLTLYGGVVADRVSRRSLLIVTQCGLMLLAFILAALVISHQVQPWHILALAFCGGVVNAFDAPARQSFVTELVELDDLTNAIALNSTMFHTATMLGPAAAGLIYGAFGPGWCFALNGVSFLAVIAALRMLDLAPFARRAGRTSTLGDLKEGLRYVASEKIVCTLIVMVAATCFFGLSIGSLIPAWTVNIMHGKAALNGVLYSARGAGSFLGALTIASLGRFQFRGRLITFGSFAFPCFMLAFAMLRWLPLELLALVGMGMGTIMLMNLANSMVQSLSPDDLRGRVMGIYVLFFFGTMPLGALWIGFLAERYGEPAALVTNACGALAVAALVQLFIPRLRRL
jgi:MFS family permease